MPGGGCWSFDLTDTLVDAFQIPAIFKCDQGTICEGLEGLCILLKCFAFPCQFSDMIPIFGRPVPELCMINNTVIDWVYNHHRHRIMDWNPNVLSPIQLENYVEAVFNKGAALRNCFGFVDGTVRPISRPDEIVRGPESETLPPVGDFCRHVSFQSFTWGYLKNACLHLIGWWVWLCSNILFLSKESQVTHTKKWVNLFWNTITAELTLRVI